ncbi:MAG: ABC-2 family transporter protein [Myxococcota bacterium]
MLAPYLAFSRAALARQWTYGTANWAGLFTNCFFLFFRAYALGACFEAQDTIGGLSEMATLTYVTVSQSLVMVCPQWGTLGLAASVRSGQVAIDLLRPVDLYGSLLARRLAISAYYLVARTVPVLAIGWLSGLLSPPDLALLPWFFVSVGLGAVLGTTIFVIIEVSSFWLESERGVRYLVMGLAALPSGLVLPVDFFGEWLQPLFRILPFSHTLYTPTRLWMGDLPLSEVAELLTIQLGWTVLLVLVARRLIEAGSARLQVLGG